ncbi:hypothetical protein CP533_2427 [Ophiocordyceps camponoti-saundersi (nom. inval.)]|nr:hypothetical protein CP533_2427 [Ophiocordyceps camponoti-saundersi (nom. inval.)]
MRLHTLTAATLARALIVPHSTSDSHSSVISRDDPQEEFDGARGAEYFYRGDPREPSVVFLSGFEARPGDGDIKESSLTLTWVEYLRDAFEKDDDSGFVYVVNSRALGGTKSQRGFLEPNRIPGTAVAHAYKYNKESVRDNPILIRNPNYRSEPTISRFRDDEGGTGKAAPSILQVCNDLASHEKEEERSEASFQAMKLQLCGARDSKTLLTKRKSFRLGSGLRQLANTGLTTWAEGEGPPCQLPPDFKFKTVDGKPRVKNTPFVSPLLGPKGNPQSEIGLILMDLLNQYYDEMDMEEACGAKSAREAEENKAKAFARAREMIQVEEDKAKAFARARELIEEKEKKAKLEMSG